MVRLNEREPGAGSPGRGQPGGPDAILTRPAPPPDMVLRYGDDPDQIADLRLPPRGPAAAAGASPVGAFGGMGVPAPVVVFLHGGFWRDEHDRSHTGPLAAALAARGYVVCVPEFRRTGPGRSGWPGTFDDVAAAVDALPGMIAAAARAGAASDNAREEPESVVLAGHSAGGHLALWAAARHRLPAGTAWRTAAPPPVRAVVGLAAVSDLRACHDDGLGGGAAAELMGASPAAMPVRYAAADPAGLLPLGVPVLLVHGTQDDKVPARMSRSFAARARAAGDDVVLRELPACEHFGLIDPLSAAWPQVLAAFAAAARA